MVVITYNTNLHRLESYNDINSYYKDIHID